VRTFPLFLAALLSGLASCGGGSEGSGPTLVSATPAELAMEDQVFALVNLERDANAVTPLIESEDLRLVARAHSQDMVRRMFFDHVNPDGLNPADRVQAAGIPYTSVGENIAWNYGYADPGQTAVDWWMNSSGHRANILNGGYTHSGVGVAQRLDGAWFFTQLFAQQTGSLLAVTWVERGSAGPDIADGGASSWSLGG